MTEDAALLAAARTTIDTFGSIVGRKLALRNGRTARIDHDDIVVPFQDDDPYLLVERQLAHVLFKSDARAREKFIQEFLRRTVKSAYQQSMPAVDFAEMQPTLERVVDILESRRIESLWGLLYPGSAARSKERLRAETADLVASAHDSLFSMLVCLDAGHEIPSGPLDAMRPHLEEALMKVERRGFDATLTIARWLISRLVSQVSDDAQGGAGRGSDDAEIRERMQALRSLHAQFGQLPKKLEQRYSDYQGHADKQDASEVTMRSALTLDLRNEKMVESRLDSSSKDMASFMKGIQDRLEVVRDRDEWLREDPRCLIDFIDVQATDKPLRPREIFEDDEVHVRKLRRLFAQVMSRRESRREDTGVEVDVGAYIERKLSGVPVPCFKVPQRSRGFRALILVDRSFSMRGSRTRQAERGVQLLLDALDFPFVEVGVWGFQGFDGEVTLTRFDPNVESLDTERSLPVNGETPLHLAMRAGVRDLMEGSEVRHIFVLTDGGPYFANKDGKVVPERQLRQEVRDEVLKARRFGINVTALLIGNRTKKGELVFDVSEKHVEHMFGARRHWRYVDDQVFASDLVQAVTQSFVAYLNEG